MLLVFLTYGKGFGGPIDFLNTHGLDSTEKLFSPCIYTSSLNEEEVIISNIYIENYFCKTPSRRCLEYKYLMNSENEEHTHCAKLFNFYKEMKSFGITKVFNSSIDLANTSNSQTFVESSSAYAPPINIKINELQNINLEEYFSLQIDPTYYRGFGIRIGI